MLMAVKEPFIISSFIYLLIILCILLSPSIFLRQINHRFIRQESDSGILKVISSHLNEECAPPAIVNKFFWRRRNNIRHACTMAGQPNQLKWKEFEEHHKNRLYIPRLHWWHELYVNEKFKLLFCANLKAGNSNIKNYIIYLSSHDNFSATPIYSYDEYKLEIVHAEFFKSEHLRRLSEYSIQDAKRIMKTYTKFVFIRDPFQRLLSAWRDKFSSWDHDPFYAEIAEGILARLRPHLSSETAIRASQPLSFDEFMHFVYSVNDSRDLDHHWRPQYQICNLCQIGYDYVGVMDSDFACQLQHIMTRVIGDKSRNIPLPPTPPNANRLHVYSRANFSEDSLQIIGKTLRRHYQNEYAILGFDMPKFV